MWNGFCASRAAVIHDTGHTYITCVSSHDANGRSPLPLRPPPLRSRFWLLSTLCFRHPLLTLFHSLFFVPYAWRNALRAGQGAAAAAAAGMEALYADDVDMGEAMPWSFPPASGSLAGTAVIRYTAGIRYIGTMPVERACAELRGCTETCTFSKPYSAASRYIAGEIYWLIQYRNHTGATYCSADDTQVDRMISTAKEWLGQGGR